MAQCLTVAKFHWDWEGKRYDTDFSTYTPTSFIQCMGNSTSPANRYKLGILILLVHIYSHFLLLNTLKMPQPRHRQAMTPLSDLRSNTPDDECHWKAQYVEMMIHLDLPPLICHETEQSQWPRALQYLSIPYREQEIILRSIFGVHIVLDFPAEFYKKYWCLHVCRLELHHSSSFHIRSRPSFVSLQYWYCHCQLHFSNAAVPNDTTWRFILLHQSMLRPMGFVPKVCFLHVKIRWSCWIMLHQNLSTIILIKPVLIALFIIIEFT